MLENEKRELIIYAKKIYDAGLTRGTGGNFSIYNRSEKLMAITPSGIPYTNMIEKDIVIMDLHGRVLEGDLKPSSEYMMHTLVYKNREDVNAMIHMHSRFCTALSTLRISLPAIDYLIAYSGGKEVKVADYASFGSIDLAENALKTLGNQNAVLLANHGINCVAYNMMKAFEIADEMEFCAELYMRAKAVGEPVILSDNEMKFMVEKFKEYGQKRD